MKLVEVEKTEKIVGYECPYCGSSVVKGSAIKAKYPERWIFKGREHHIFLVCPRCERQYSMLDGREIYEKI